jgi:hypothetical protein
MPPLHAPILTDAMVIQAAHKFGYWNALRKSYQLHSVQLCVEEATRPNKFSRYLVQRTYAAVAAELTMGAVTDRMRLELRMLTGHQADLDAGERDLLAYGLSLGQTVWWLCGPDNGTVLAMQTLRNFDRMVSLEALARQVGCRITKLPTNYTDRWLSNHRLQLALKSG